MKLFYWIERVIKGWYYHLTDDNATRKMASDRLYWCYKHKFPRKLYLPHIPVNGCPSRIGSVCGECGCFLKAKARIKEEICPLNHWPDVEETIQTQE